MAVKGIHVDADKQYGLIRLAERFEVPYEMTQSPLFPQFLERVAREVVKISAEKNALRGYQWQGTMPVEIDKSELQIPLDIFGSTDPDIPAALDSGNLLKEKYDKVAYVVKMWYVAPKVFVEPETEEEMAISEEHGFTKENPQDKKGIVKV